MIDNRATLVFGATGQQGGAVARALRSEGRPVKALVRDTSGTAARSLAAEGCEIVQGDLRDRDSIERAMAGMDSVFSVQPSSGQGSAYGVTDADEIRYATAVADAAQAAGVRHLVYSSVAAAGERPTGMGHFDSKIDVERHLASLAMPVTVVRPATFMEILVLPGMGLEDGRLSFLMRPEQVVQFVAVADIGRIVAAILADPGRFAGSTLEIASDAITGNELARKMSGAAGRDIRYERLPDAVLARDPFLNGLAELFDDGRLAGHADLDRLRALVPDLETFDTWLATDGGRLLENALEAEPTVIALR